MNHILKNIQSGIDLGLRRKVFSTLLKPNYSSILSFIFHKKLNTGLALFSEINPLVKKLLDGLQSGNRASLAEAITLVETTNVNKKVLARLLLNNVLHLRNKEYKHNNTFRIGLTGPPGAGKSTFIEYFGKFLTNKNLKVAVLAIDPSSVTTGGSILGDKTRMTMLSRDMNAYIRPSPSRGHLGGVTRSTNEAIVLCEAAGYDVIIIETIGVGQSEYAVADMVDIFALIMPPGVGDELQGLKKGIMELSDLVIVNKSDGDLIAAARRVQYEYISALKYIHKKNKVWKPVVHCVSSIHGNGIEELWKIMMSYRDTMREIGYLESNRKEQQKAWLWTHLKDNVLSALLDNSSVKEKLKHYETKVMNNGISPGDAADIIFKHIIESFSKKG